MRMNSEWEKGFDAGYKFAVDNWNADTGKYMIELPETFVHRNGHYNCGYGEGLISGRSQKIESTFGKIKEIHWENGRAVIKR